MEAELSFRSVCGELTFCGKSDACFLSWKIRLSQRRILNPWYHLRPFSRTSPHWIFAAQEPGVVVAQVATLAVPVFSHVAGNLEVDPRCPSFQLIIIFVNTCYPHRLNSNQHLSGNLVDCNSYHHLGMCIYETEVCMWETYRF